MIFLGQIRVPTGQVNLYVFDMHGINIPFFPRLATLMENTIFSKSDAEDILRVRVGNWEGEDYIAWNWTANGLFTDQPINAKGLKSMSFSMARWADRHLL
jgi:hypothetical protein